MGHFSTTYGFYSADWDTTTYGVGNAMGEGGEALTVADPDEAWVFHIVSCRERHLQFLVICLTSETCHHYITGPGSHWSFRCVGGSAGA